MHLVRNAAVWCRCWCYVGTCLDTYALLSLADCLLTLSSSALCCPLSRHSVHLLYGMKGHHAGGEGTAMTPIVFTCAFQNREFILSLWKPLAHDSPVPSTSLLLPAIPHACCQSKWATKVQITSVHQILAARGWGRHCIEAAYKIKPRVVLLPDILWGTS